MEKSIKEIATVMGGENGDQYGPEGPLYALWDRCLNNIEAGKYTYGICLFGAGSQKEGDGCGMGLGNGPEPDLMMTAIRCGPGKWSLLLECSSTICHGTHQMWPEENQIVSAEEPDMYSKWKATLLMMKGIESGIVCKYQMIVKNRDSLFGTYTYTPYILVCWEAVHTGTQASSTARYRNDLVLVVVVAVFVSHPGSKRRRRLTPPNSKSKSPQLKNLPQQSCLSHKPKRNEPARKRV